MLTMLRFWMLIALVMLSACEAVAGGWDLVRPSIRFQGDVFDSPDGYPQLYFTEEVRITYIGDSLLWTAEELASRMSAIGLNATVHEISNLFDTTLCNSDSASQEILLTLSNPDLELLFDSNEDFFLRFGLVGIPDEYTIWTRDCACVEGVLENNCLISIIAATDLRGLLYGVTSFTEAIHEDVVEQWIKPMMIRDYPSFPRRIIGDKYDLGGGGQFANSAEHGRGLLSAARSLLLNNKGNGLIQLGAVSALDSCATEVFEILRDGVDTAAHTDTWESLSMDWYQGINWWGTETLKGREKKSALVRKICYFDSIYVDNGNTERISVVPIPLDIPVENADFEELLGVRFRFWEDDASWSQQLEGGNNFAQVVIAADETEIISTYWHLQDTVGLPMRQVVLEFDVRVSAGDEVEVWVESLMPPDSNGIPSSGTDGNSYGDFRIFDKGHRDKENSFKALVIDTTWQTKHVLFYTFGLKVDHPTFYFKNVGESPATVDFDRVRLYDSDTYFVHGFFSGTNRPRPEFCKLYVLDSAGTRVASSPDGSSFSARNEELQDAWGSCSWTDWSHHARLRFPSTNLGNISLTQLQDPANRYKAELFFHAICTDGLPAFFETLNPLGPFAEQGDEDGDTCEYYIARNYWTENNPDVMAPGIVESMEIFENLWNDSGPATSVSGYFNRSNEQRFTGWTQRDLDLVAANGWNQASIYGNFNSTIIDTLNEAIAGPDRPLLLFADMFNPLHNGQRITRVNNPFETGGYLRSASTIAGADPDQPLVFVDWWSKEIRNQTNAQNLISAFDSLPNENNNWEVMFVFLPEDDVDSSAYSTRMEFYKYVAETAEENREDGRRFSGGGLMYDARDVLDSNWQAYLDRIEMLQMWWNPNPTIWVDTVVARFIPAADSTVEMVARCYPVPYPEDHEAKIDTAVLQYSFNVIRQHIWDSWSSSISGWFVM